MILMLRQKAQISSMLSFVYHLDYFCKKARQNLHIISECLFTKTCIQKTTVQFRNISIHLHLWY